MLWKSILSNKGLFGLTLLFVLSLHSNNSLSQLDFSGGIEVGVSSSQVSGDALSGFNKFGLAAGPFVRTTFNDKSSAKLGIIYVNKGSRKNADPDNGDFTSYAMKLNYLEVPLTYSYQYKEFRGESGISIGRLVSSSELGTDGVIRDFVFPFQRMDYSVLLGLNYYVSDNLFFSTYWSQSLIPVRKSPSIVNSSSFYEAGMYNTLLQFRIGYEF